ncbi:MAG: phosphate propanoyltransferase [Bacillota bacterium]
MEKIPVGVSARHMHLSAADLATLFGEGYELTVYKELRQPDQFAAQERVTLIGPKRSLENVRILGPVRSHSQVEISLTDAVYSGIDAPISFSGELEGASDVEVIGPRGRLQLKGVVIAAGRHIHASPAEAAALGISEGDLVRVRAEGSRALIFERVLVRVDESYRLEYHIDTDEANAAGLKTGDLVTLVR